ncbi:MAG TPA: helix-turn-helix transcriptional regulator [Candidatus Elarobacter sp.]|jgi:transcriptional regulator with XRE-family HTH domain
MDETIGQRMRRHRKEQRISLNALAKATRACPNTLTMIETGRTINPGFVLGCRIAEALELDPMYLALGGKPETETDVDALDLTDSLADRVDLPQMRARGSMKWRD